MELISPTIMKLPLSSSRQWTEYIAFLGKCITQLRPDIVIHRLTGDGPKELLIAPCWTGHKRLVLNKMNQYFKEQDLWQGKNYKL